MDKITFVVKAVGISFFLAVFAIYIFPASNSTTREISYNKLTGVGNSTPVSIYNSEEFSNGFPGKSAVAAPVVNIESQTNASCSDNADGSINISISGGIDPYSYSWTGPGSFSRTTQNITNLSPGTYSVTVTDDDGNTSTPKNTTIVVEDNEDPTIRTQNITVELDANGNATISAEDIDNGSDDNCQIQSRSLNIANFDCGDVGANTVTLTVTDVNGNSETGTATVTVEDKIAPTVLTQNITVELDANGNAAISAEDIDNGSTDNCQIQSRSLNITNFDCSDVGGNSVELTVTDVNGNSASKNATVTVEDNIDPIVRTQNITVQLDASGSATISAEDIDNGSDDNCQIQSRSLNITNFDCSDVGGNFVELTVTDINNNSASKTATVTIEDKLAPTVLTQNITVELDANGNATISAEDIDNGTTDNCQIQSHSLNITNFDCSDVGGNSVELTVTDVNGNSASKTATVTVEDNIKPVTPTLQDITWSCGEDVEIPTTTDNCDGEITGTTNNPLQYDSFGTYTITWTFTDDSENATTAVQKIIIPEPTVNPVNDIVVCNGETISAITFGGSTVTGTTYKWTNNNVNIGTSASGSNQIAAFEAKNTTNQIITATITVIPVANNCEGQSINFTISVNPTATITKPADIVVCDGAVVEEIDFPGISVSNTTIGWANNNAATGVGASGSGNIPSFTATNPTDASIFSTITLTPSANGCEGIEETFTIEVKPNPTATAPENKVYCNGTTAPAIPLTGSPTGVKYDITGGAAIGLSNRTAVSEIPSFTPVNNTNSPVTAEIILTPKANDCTGNSVTYEVTVNPTPNVNVTPSSQSICSGESTDISLSGTVAGTSYSWTIENPGNVEGAAAGELSLAEVQNGNKKIIQELINNSTEAKQVIYKIKPEANGCAGTPVSFAVTVNPKPVFSFIIENVLCSPTDLTDLQLKDGSTSGLSFTYFKNGSQIQNPTNVNAGTYIIHGTNPSGCFLETEVTVENSPAVDLPSGAVATCSQQPFSFQFTATDTELIEWTRLPHPSISDNSTSSGTGDIAETLNNSSNNPIEITYEIELTSSTGCITTEELHVKVNPAPKLTNLPAQEELPFEICGGDSFSFNPQSTAAGTNFRWERAFVQGIENSAQNGTGAINERLINTTSEAISVFYKIYVSSTVCSNPTPYEIPVLVKPAPVVDAQVALEGSESTSETLEICPNGAFVDLYSSVNVAEGLNAENATPQNNIIAAWNFSNSTDRAAWNNPGSGNRQWKPTANGDGAHRGHFPNGQYGVLPFNYPANQSPFFAIATPNIYEEYKDVSLVSPSFSTVGYSEATLSFQHAFKDGDKDIPDVGKVQISIDGGSTWTDKAIYNSFIGSRTEFKDGLTANNQKISLPANTQDIRIRFAYTNGYSGDSFWAITNVQIDGAGSGGPKVTWTSSTDPEWTSNLQNPKTVGPVTSETIFTATYSYDEIECSGTNSVTVKVKEALQPKITANFCQSTETNTISLSADRAYDRYEWTTLGEYIANTRSIEINTAQEYTLRVWEDGCSNTTSLNLSGNLIENGDFEQGNTGFSTVYQFLQNDPGRKTEFYDEGVYAIDTDANQYHQAFTREGDHTSGTGNFMIVNGDVNQGKVVWETSFFEVKENRDYYFSAWTMNIDTDYVTEERNFAELRILVFAREGNGNEVLVAESTLADLWNAQENRGIPPGEWLQFYSPTFWNSGSYTEARLQIINDNTYDQGNDFGLDDISFAELNAVELNFNPTNDGPVCEGGTLQLFSNLEDGRDPITYSWTGPNSFTSNEANPVIEVTSMSNEGDYRLTITDFYGCSNNEKITTVDIIPETVVNASEDQVICAETAEIELNGTITGSITTGSWQTEGGDNSRFASSTSLNTLYTPSPSEIEAGTITLILTSDEPDVPCQPVQDSITITINPTPVIDSIEITSPLCYSGNDGSAKVFVSSGTPPFSYEWSNGQTGEEATGLTALDEADALTVTITDANGCTVTSENILIEEPSLLEITSTSFTEPLCYNGQDATATIEVAGGFLAGAVPNYNYQLLNGQGDVVYSQENTEAPNLTIPDLTAGNYTFMVNSHSSCSALSQSLTITQPPEILVEAGEPVVPEECGITSVKLGATPVDPALGTGMWSIISGEGGSIQNPSSPDSYFTGQSNTTYELQWTVTPITACPDLKDTLVITLPESCSKLDFDGEDDYVDFGNNYNLINSSGTFTLEAWVKPHAVDGLRTVIAKRSLNDLSSGGYDLVINNGYPTVRFNNVSVVAAQKVSTDRWHHLAAIHTGSQIQLYVDGIRIKSQNSSASPNEIAAPMLIGAMYDPSSPVLPKNYFKGWIEEVRIWDTALTQEQLRFMMNQRIKSNGAKVKGEIIPLDVPDITWDKLSGYYRMISAEVQNGITTNLVLNDINGYLKNIRTSQNNSAPLPYESEQTGKWHLRSTWDPASSKFWTFPNDTGINGDKIDWNIVRARNNINSDHADIQVLGLLVSNSGMVDMLGSNNSSGNSLTVSHYLDLDGVIDLNGESQLLQSEGSILAETSSGCLEREQQGTASSFNYNYWSSPVVPQGAANNSGYTVAGTMMDGSNTGNFGKAMNFGNSHTYADGDFSTPRKVSNYWINAFRARTADAYSAWEQIGSNAQLKVGEGFTMKGTSGKEEVEVTDEQNYVFKGKPNNGDITLDIGPTQNYLVGNPYPSGLSVNQFFLDNLNIQGGRSNKNAFNGALYFWDHFSGRTHVLSEYVGGYAVLNLVGSVAAIATDERINASGAGSTRRPGNVIPVGQGFFINTEVNNNSGGELAGNGGQIKFTNSQRRFRKEGSNSQFLKPEIREKSAETEENKSRIRLNFHSPLGYHRQILLGIDQHATNAFDIGYDALLNDYNLEDMFWLIDGWEYVIQGVGHINPDQVLPIGLRIEKAGELQILIEEMENISEDVDIYIRDKSTENYHDLRDSEFTLEIEPGDYYERFELVFQKPEIPEEEEENTEEELPGEEENPEELPGEGESPEEGEDGTPGEEENPEEGSENPDTENPKEDPEDENGQNQAGISVEYLINRKQLVIYNPGAKKIDEVRVFTLNGQQLETFTEATTEKEIYLHLMRPVSTSVYIVKVHTAEKIYNKKIIVEK
ncbi:PKD-like domain-containing protein [Zunongwangia sp. F260]|uniref:PKD-like domain-containing protein n=1 Tax=Autumnicola lenta TaxID=3075593 RepID=A0ABU3CME8_9FLAO|nr:PKD-like domain-containing protein [Zunongwangia sp. F260]MDT0647519.1 PKD-like domain-containing protein [Zunongwangia sp. F260]